MNRMLTMAAACVLAAGLAAPAAAQDYPTQTIKIISSFGAGGGSDIIARILAQRMQEKLGQNVIVENRPGAGGVLGNEAGRQRAQGRLHARRPDRRPDHRLGHHQEHALRRGRRVRLGRADRDRGPVHRGAAGLPLQGHQVAGRVRQGQSRQDRVRQPGIRRHAAPRRRTVQADPPASRCCTCPIAPRPRCSRRCSPRTSTWWSTPSRRCSVRSSRARSWRSRVTGKDRFPTTPNIPPVIEFGRGAELRRQHLVRPVRTEGHAARGHRQAQQDAQRDAGGARDPRAAGQDRRGGERLDTRRVRAAHGGRARQVERRCARRRGSNRNSDQDSRPIANLYSGLSPADLRRLPGILELLLDVVARNPWRSAACGGTSSAPAGTNLSCTDFSASALISAFSSMATISGGVFAGASTPT